MKRALACLSILLVMTVFGCGGGINTPPPPLTYYNPPDKPFGHSLAIGRFQDKSFARYSLFIGVDELREVFQDELERNKAFMNVFTLPLEKNDDRARIEEKALDGKANLLMEGELTESLCRLEGWNSMGVPVALTYIIFPISFNIKAQTWQGAAEVVYRIRDIKTDRVLLNRRVQAVAYKNFSIWEERTERQLNKNFIRHSLTPPVLQNLKTAITKDILTNFKD